MKHQDFIIHKSQNMVLVSSKQKEPKKLSQTTVEVLNRNRTIKFDSACKVILSLLFILFCTFAQAQSTISFSGNDAQETNVVFTSVDQVATFYHLTPTGGTFTSAKGEKSPIYASKKGTKYAIVSKKPTAKNQSTYTKKSLKEPGK